VRSKHLQVGPKAGTFPEPSFGEFAPAHWDGSVRLGSPTGLPFASDAGRIDAGVRKPELEVFGQEGVFENVPPSFMLLIPFTYETSARNPAFVSVRSWLAVSGRSWRIGLALG